MCVCVRVCTRVVVAHVCTCVGMHSRGVCGGACGVQYSVRVV